MRYLGLVEKHHENAKKGLYNLLREIAQKATKDCYPFQTTIKGYEKLADVEFLEVIDITGVRVEGFDVVVMYMQGNEEYEDCAELFSYDELYDILCNLCKRLEQ